MLMRLMAGLLSAVVLAAAMLTAASAQDAKKEKDVAKEKKTDKDTKEIKGKVIKVDVDKMTFTVETEDGKKLDFKADDDVKWLGPQGGVHKQGIKDERFKIGAKVSVVTDASGKTVKEVHLPRLGKDRAKDKDKAIKEKDK